MAVSIEQQDDCWDQSATRQRRAVIGSDRPSVIRRMAAFVGVSLSSAGLERFAQLIAMQREDLVAEIVDQFEHRQRHLGRPKTRDLDGSRTQVRGAVLRFAHDLPPRRWRARCSVRSRASLCR